jgi:hypothetical protein
MRRTRHRRRFHTDRIVNARRARYLWERGAWEIRFLASDEDRWAARRLSYGRLSTMDPWDCGRSCWSCHFDKREPGRRTRAERAWRTDWSR